MINLRQKKKMYDKSTRPLKFKYTHIYISKFLSNFLK